MMISNIEKKHDGSYIISYNGMPYHADPEQTPEVYQQVLECIKKGDSVNDYVEPELPPEPSEDILERDWAISELALTDRCLTPDFPITKTGIKQVTEYRRLLRNPARSSHPNYPDPIWRPTWPEGVKRPAG